MKFYTEVVKIIVVLLLFKIVILLFTKEEIDYLINLTVIVVSLLIDPSNVKELYKGKRLK